MFAIRTLALTALLLSLSVPASGAVRPAGTTGPLGDERLSNETTITRWAHVAQRVVVRRAPRPDAGGIARLRYFTEDDKAEVYLVLASRRTDTGVWLHVRVPGRPNGRTGWVPATALGPLHTVSTRLVIVRRTGRATLYRDGRAIWRAPVGTGAPGTPT